MSEPIIKVNNLGKKYIIGHKVEKGAIKGGFPTLRDRITDTANWAKTKVTSKLNGEKMASPAIEEFWALKDISFEVHAGEIVGFIGRNGAGKSTLLKTLSRITEPTTGEIILNGRVASLLEVGTGFHPELTGRENIFLNGAILGMSRIEIKKKFDEIVDFSEVEKFLDTPVKRYSSGMYVRLAFAVAAHLEPDILIVDEVLAVGDIAFQKKCLGKMEDVVAKENRTVIFVSHNMLAVRSLCNKAYFLDGGKIIAEGSVKNITNQYLKSLVNFSNSEPIPLEQRRDRSGDGSAKLVSFKFEDADTGGTIYSNSRLKITIGYRSEKPLSDPRFIVNILDHESNTGIIALDSKMVKEFPEDLPFEGQVTCITAPINLTPGQCHFNLELWRESRRVDRIKQAVYFNVEEKNIFNGAELPGRGWAINLINQNWYSNV